MVDLSIRMLRWSKRWNQWNTPPVFVGGERVESVELPTGKSWWSQWWRWWNAPPELVGGEKGGVGRALHQSYRVEVVHLKALVEYCPPSRWSMWTTNIRRNFHQKNLLCTK